MKVDTEDSRDAGVRHGLHMAVLFLRKVAAASEDPNVAREIGECADVLSQDAALCPDLLPDHTRERLGIAASTDDPPANRENNDLWLMVIADMEARRHLGIERYGVPVRPHNGRDALRDAYEEALDLAVYLRQAIAERLLISDRDAAT